MKIKNFRGIVELDVALQPGLTLLVGRNNVGKSRVLRAMEVAVGGSRAQRDDLTIGSDGPAELDIVIAPNDVGADEQEEFSADVSRRLGDGISLVSVDPQRERFGWRAVIDSASERSGARVDFYAMVYAGEGWTVRENAKQLTRQQLMLFHADFIDTRRDIDSDLRRPGSAIRQILNDLGFPDVERSDLESRLSSLGEEIASRSATLIQLRTAIDQLATYVGEVGAVRIDPVPASLEELARTVGVSFDSAAKPIPSRLQGSGVRSLGSLQVQRAFFDHRLGSDGPGLRPHAVALIEEPEAHLHPHAIFELPSLLEREGVQTVATTHSSQLATAVAPDSLVLLRLSPAGEYNTVNFRPAKSASESTSRVQHPEFFPEEMAKLKRLVERPFGELLFARAMVIGDGATERAFLPAVIQEALGTLGHAISVIDSNGMNVELVNAVAKFGSLAEIPLIVLADGDDAGQQSADRLLANGSVTRNNIIWVESESAPKDESQPSRNNREPVRGIAFEKMLLEFDINVCMRACEAIGKSATTSDAVLRELKSSKGAIGSFLAQEFLSSYPCEHQDDWPAPLRELVSRLAAVLNE